ncbi:putative RhoGEF domain containing protein [Blattamonas nauphoetae]|uniref:RhoGEF domain containing protein n=1 Tax=Blattamonas nauphoetae TaxID=2049346 RepID=A0ABQ9XI90_9EUKA|nr:putative RhoGEF domain containing protein [Blattamonas nauphoetae]
MNDPEFGLKPTNKKGLGLTARETHMLFSNLTSILNTNSMLCERFAACQQKEGKGIGQIFLILSDFLKCYTPYVSNLTQIQELTTNLMTKNKQFKEFCTKQEDDPRSKGYKLPTYLVLPVQRIPRYELLLQQVLKFTEDGDPEKADLENALLKVKAICIIVNQAKTQSSQKQRLISIQDSTYQLDPKTQSLILPSRRLLFESPSTLYDLQDGKIVKQQTSIHFILFNDSVFYQVCKQKRLYFGGLYPLHLDCTHQVTTLQLAKTEVSGISISFKVPNKYDPVHPGGETAFQSLLQMPAEDEENCEIKTLTFGFADKTTLMDMLNHLSEAVQEMKKARRTFIRQSLSQTHEIIGPTSSPPPQEDSDDNYDFGDILDRTDTNVISPVPTESPTHMKEANLERFVAEEDHFVDQLRAILDDYLRPLNDRPHGFAGLSNSSLIASFKLNPQEVNGIFGEIDTLFKTHSFFLSSLKGDSTGKTPINLGQVFLKLADVFNIYKLFTPKLPERKEKLHQLMEQNDGFRKFITETDANSKLGMTLDELLDAPVTRLHMYPAVLYSMYESTPTDDPEREDFEKAKKKVDAVVEAVNRSTEIFTRKNDLTKLFVRLKRPPWSDRLLTATRMLLRTDEVEELAVTTSPIVPAIDLDSGTIFSHWTRSYAASSEEEKKKMLVSLNTMTRDPPPSYTTRLNSLQKADVAGLWKQRQDAFAVARKEATAQKVSLPSLLHTLNDTLIFERLGEADSPPLVRLASMDSVVYVSFSTDRSRPVFEIGFFAPASGEKDNEPSPAPDSLVTLAVKFKSGDDLGTFRKLFIDSAISTLR